MLEAGACLEVVRGVVIGRNDGAGIAGAEQGAVVWSIDRPQGFHPTVLGEVVVIDADAGSQHGFPRTTGSVGNSQARGDGLAIIARDAGREGNAKPSERPDRGVLVLTAAFGEEQPKSSVVTRAPVERESRARPPRFLKI